MNQKQIRIDFASHWADAVKNNSRLVTDAPAKSEAFSVYVDQLQRSGYITMRQAQAVTMEAAPILYSYLVTIKNSAGERAVTCTAFDIAAVRKWAGKEVRNEAGATFIVKADGRARTTETDYDIEVKTAEGWELATSEKTMKLAREMKTLYQEEQPGQYRIKAKRVKTTGALFCA